MDFKGVQNSIISQGIKVFEIPGFIEFMISISRPEKSWNSSEGHRKLWKSNMFSENKKAKR